MPLIESLITGVGASVAGAIVKMWFKDEPIAAAIGESVFTTLGKKIPDMRQRKATARQLDEIGDRAAESILVMLEKEADDVSEKDLKRLANAAGETLANTPIDAGLLANKNLEPKLLTEHFLGRTGGEGGNPKYAEEGSATDREKEIYRQILDHSSGLIVDVASQLPQYSERVQGEILRRETHLSETADRIMDGVDRLLAAQTGENPDDERFETNYRQACIRRLDQLELFGVDLQESNKRYKLSVAYVSLEVERLGSNSDKELSVDEEDGNSCRQPMPVDHALASTNRLFVRGPAGSGKTTLLQWAAVFTAGRDLERELESLNELVPFLLRLRDYSDEPLPNPEEFPNAMSRALAGKPDDWVHRQLLSGKAIVMVDGVDEAAESRRDEVRQWLRDLVEQYSNARFVVTSRPHAAKEGWLDAEGFVDASLQQMGRNDIYQFIDHWHDAIRDGISDPDDQAKLPPLAKALKVRLREDGSVFKLASSPLLCAILCALHRDRKEDLPKDRIELYRACIEMFFRRDRERRVSMEGYPELSDRQKHRLLQNFAWWLIKNGNSSASPEECEKRFEAELAQLKDRPSDANGAEVKKLLIERVGILRQLSSTKIDFPHRTFQEYLAAHEAVAEDDTGLLIKNAHDDQWREVTVLAAGIMDSAKDAEAFISKLLARGDRTAQHRITLYIIAAAALESVVKLPDSDKLRNKAGNRLSKIVPPKSITAAKELASAGDLVVPYLSYNSRWNGNTAAAAVRTLLLIASDAASDALPDFMRDSRAVVWNELMKALACLPEDLSARIQTGFLDSGVQPTVKILDLNSTQVTDIKVLASCISLRSLNLGYTQVSDISALAACTELQSLLLHRTQVSDISALTACAKLQELRLHETQVSDISVLANCLSLQLLRLARTDVSNVSALTACTSLESLDLAGTEVSDVSALAACTSLESLDLEDTGVSDVSALAACTSLQSLNLANTRVRDVSALAALPSLHSLNLHNTQVSDVRPLSTFTSLQLLNLANTEVSDVSALAEVPTLGWLSLGNTKVSDVSALATCPSLHSLSLANTRVSDVSALASCASLKSLNLHHMQVSNDQVKLLRQQLLRYKSQC